MGFVRVEVGIQICLLFITGILSELICTQMGNEFMVLIPPVREGTNIVIIGPAKITFKNYGSLSIQKTNESAITTSYRVDQPAADGQGLSRSNTRVLSIRANKPVNVYVQSSQGGAFTALRKPSNKLSNRRFVIATTDPGANCSTYIVVVAYTDDVMINGIIRGRNATAVFHRSSKTLQNVERLQNEKIKKRGGTFLITSSTDLSGTFIQADKPVAVFAGVECGESSSTVTFRTIQIAHLSQLSQSYVSVSIHHDIFTDAIFKEVKISGEREDIGPETKQSRRSSRQLGIVVQTVHVNMSYTRHLHNTALQTIFNVNPKLNYSLVAFSGFNTTLLLVQEKCGHCDGSIKLDQVDISRSDLTVLMNTSTTLAFLTPVKPGVHFLQSSTKFTLYAYGISYTSFYSYDAPCVSRNFTEKKLTSATKNNTEITTAREMKSVEREDDESVVTSTRGIPSVTKETDESSSTTKDEMASTVTATVLLSENTSTPSTVQTQAGSLGGSTPAHDTTTAKVTPAGTNTCKSPKRRICPNRPCMCRSVSNTLEIDDIEKEELKAHLAIDTRNVGARFRSKNSIQDNRPVARALGCVGIFIMFTPMIVVVMLDMRRLFRLISVLWHYSHDRKL